jgi:hypothetical protein
LENVANYQYFGTTLPNQDHINEELGADEMLVVWHNSVCLRVFYLNKNIILPVVWYGYVSSCLTLRGGHRILRGRVLNRTLRPKEIK